MRKPSLRSLRSAPWILRLPFDEAARAARVGAITDAQWEAYRWAWRWASPRFGGDAGDAQDTFAMRFGDEALERRRRRVRHLIAALTLAVVTGGPHGAH